MTDEMIVEQQTMHELGFLSRYAFGHGYSMALRLAADEIVKLRREVEHLRGKLQSRQEAAA